MKRRSSIAIFAIPALLAIGTVAGLIAGLIGDGGWDWAANALLAPPIVLAIAKLRSGYAG